MQASLRSANAVRTLQDRFRPEAMSSACPKRRQPPDEPADWHIGHPRPAAMPSQATSPHTSSSKPPWRPPTRTPNSDVMQTDTGKATRVISEGRHKASGAVSVAWLTDTGPRDENQDRAVARLHDDSSWLVAVADGMGGHPRGRDASKTAIKALPRLVDTQEAMYQAFKAAHETVFKLAPKYARYSRHEVRKCPASTLCVAAWTPAGGLLVGIAGDTRPVVLWRDDDSWHGRTLGRLHRNISIYGYITKYLGAPRSWPAMGANDRDPMDIFADDDIDLPADPTAIAVAIVSDGVWEPLVREVYAGKAKQADPVGKAIAACVTPDDHTAHSIAPPHHGHSAHSRTR